MKYAELNNLKNKLKINKVLILTKKLNTKNQKNLIIKHQNFIKKHFQLISQVMRHPKLTSKIHSMYWKRIKKFNLLQLQITMLWLLRI